MTCPSGKRCFGSKRHARKASRKIGNRIRVYPCPECGRWHISGKIKGRWA
jgi:predicted RNA-binding Zn-ribbon protein involved in translation (DUF1610 family)